ncbi:ABC transporter ATP-binding protein [Candidatus Nitrosocosmicus agrestis]|jgi:putative ABC transport system ATP-binding protein|uniref:ABC transporter ATP-binding protein n=1 Tax=Candidatus Nitrosocosmicus agrestis TaxID=2563600 RepID=UPI001E60FA81|nr:ABC transporter ATP-binding protein [Candidatus Nitrosocosmicus sp. SS]
MNSNRAPHDQNDLEESENAEFSVDLNIKPSYSNPPPRVSQQNLGRDLADDSDVVVDDTARSNNAKKTNRSNIAMEVRNLHKIYESQAGKSVVLKGINFIIKKGEFVSIVGPSGSGKSTLLNIMGALDTPSSGKIFINNVDIFALSKSQIADMRNKLIGYIFQSYNLINRTTVQKNVEIPAIIAGMSDKQRKSRALKLLDLLGIKNKSNYKPTNLSGGQQQRVAIARSLMNNPAIILADEATGNLDTKTGEEVFELLRMLTKRYNRTIVFVTHNPELAARTDRTIFIKDGQVERESINQKYALT